MRLQHESTCKEGQGGAIRPRWRGNRMQKERRSRAAHRRTNHSHLSDATPRFKLTIHVSTNPTDNWRPQALGPQPFHPCKRKGSRFNPSLRWRPGQNGELLLTVLGRISSFYIPRCRQFTDAKKRPSTSILPGLGPKNQKRDNRRVANCGPTSPKPGTADDYQLIRDRIHSASQRRSQRCRL